MNDLHVYLPRDRRAALAHGVTLPDRVVGSALFADISGFTALTERLARTLGPRRGAEVLADQLERIYRALIAEVHGYGGSVLGFSGDAVTCWFDGDDGGRAAAAALAMQEAMAPMSAVTLPRGGTASLAVTATWVTGPARRFVVGDPALRRIDVIAGRTLNALASAEKLAEPGEVVAGIAVGNPPDERLVVSSWRGGTIDGYRFAIVEGLAEAVEPPLPPDDVEQRPLDEAQLRSWLLPPVYQRLRQLRGFQGDFRPAAALFLSFRGIDYDGDDDAGRQLDGFVRWVQKVAHEFGGSLVQLTIGDKGSYLYLAFGAPIAHDDDAVRAVGCAMALLHHPFTFIEDIGIGVSHGQMYAGAYGSPTRQTYGVLGAKTNLAARLMGRAAPGQILCDEEVTALARRAWDFRSLPAIQVKGKTEAVEVATPIAPVIPGYSQLAAEGAEPPVGREDALQLLKSVGADLLTGRGGLLSLEGGAGIGKSRLAHALVAEVAAGGARVLRGSGSGQQLGPLGSYRGWRGMFRALFAIDTAAWQGATPERLGDYLEAHLRDHVPQWLHRLPLLADVLDVKLADTPATATLEPALRQDNLFELLIELLVSSSLEAPLLLVLDDAQALDSLSWELLKRVASEVEARGVPLLLLLATRPLDRERPEAAILEGLREQPSSRTLRLAPLAPSDTLVLAATLLGATAEQLSGALATLIRERSGGNPFFVEELLRTLSDRGLIETREEAGGVRYDLRSDLSADDFELPGTLQGLILSRLDRLEPGAQLLLKVAAVIGREFEARPVRAALGRFSAATEPFDEGTVNRLIRDDFIDAVRHEPELIYAFTQLLTHEVTYRTLLFAQRRQLHQLVAEWFETTYGDSLDQHHEALAYHWSNAAEDADDPNAIRTAVGYLIKVGDRSSFLGARLEAIDSLERALSLLPGGDAWVRERATLQIHLGEVHGQMSAYAAAISSLDEGLTQALAAEDDHLEVRARAGLSLVHFRRGDYDATLQGGVATMEAARRSGDDLGVAHALSLLGLVAAYQSDLELAKQHLHEGLALFRAHEHRDGVANNLNTLGVVALFEDDLDAAQRSFDEALAIARELEDRDKIGKYLANLALVAENRGDLDRAADYYAESRVIFEEISARQDIITNLLSLGDIAAAREQDEEARRRYLEVLPEALALDALPIALLSVRGVAWTEARAGRLQRAAELLGVILEHPARNTEVEQQVDTVLELFRDQLEPEQLEGALVRGRELPFEVLVQQLLEG